ncbi:hypothetical protein Tco_0300252 [Tanacetum coccineum]
MAKIQEVPTADSGTDTEPLKQVQYDAEYNVFANERQHSEQPESISNTCVVEKVDSNVIPDSPDMCDNDIQTDQNAEDEGAAIANLIFVRARSVFILPYGMLLTHLFNHVTAEYPRLQSPQNVLVDRVMLSLGAPRQRKPRKDIGVKRTRHSTSSSTAFDHDSFSHQVDDDENRGDEGTSRVSTPSPTTYFNSLSQNIPQVFSNPLPHEQTMENLFTRQTSMLN